MAKQPSVLVTGGAGYVGSHVSLLTDRAVGAVVGFGAESYLLGLRGLVARMHAGGATKDPEE